MKPTPPRCAGLGGRETGLHLVCAHGSCQWCNMSREQLRIESLEYQLAATIHAKQENDERFMTERDTARSRVEQGEEVILYLLGQVEQARECGAYAGSDSMKTAVDAARKYLGLGETSCEPT